MPFFYVVRALFALVSLIILAAAAYLLWTWYRGEWVVDANGALHRVRKDWRLWTGIPLLAWSFLGRSVVLPLLTRSDREPMRLERGDGRVLDSPTGAKLYVETYGPPDGQPIVLTHGWSLDSRIWFYAKRDLAKDFRLVVWDFSGAPVHVYKATPEARGQVEFMRAVFASGTPSFGSCAGLQIAVAAAGGTVRENPKGHEIGIARRIMLTDVGRSHPLLAGRPPVYDAATIHSDEVDALPSEGATLLATSCATRVQATELRFGKGLFWGVQYHPELPLLEIADAVLRQTADAVQQGLARAEGDVEVHAALIRELGKALHRCDLAWRLGVNEQVADPKLRQTELRNFIEQLVMPAMSRRGRG